MPGPALSLPALPLPALFALPMWPGLALLCLAWLGLALPCHALPCLALPCFALPCPFDLAVGAGRSGHMLHVVCVIHDVQPKLLSHFSLSLYFAAQLSKLTGILTSF